MAAACAARPPFGTRYTRAVTAARAAALPWWTESASHLGALPAKVARAGDAACAAAAAAIPATQIATAIATAAA
jgi:hypothetical protein